MMTCWNIWKTWAILLWLRALCFWLYFYLWITNLTSSKLFLKHRPNCLKGTRTYVKWPRSGAIWPAGSAWLTSLPAKCDFKLASAKSLQTGLQGCQLETRSELLPKIFAIIALLPARSRPNWLVHTHSLALPMSIAQTGTWVTNIVVDKVQKLFTFSPLCATNVSPFTTRCRSEFNGRTASSRSS